MVPFLPLVLQPTHAHLEGTLLPRGFFLVLGLIYLAALAVDRLAERLRLPASAAILLLGLAISWGMAGIHHVSTLHVESIHRISLALLIFYAGLGTDLRRIRGTVGAGLGLATLGVVLTLLIVGLVLKLAGPALGGEGLAMLPLSAAWLAACCLTPTDSGALEDLLESLERGLSGRLRHLLHFEAALSTLSALLLFGFLAGFFHAHSPHESMGLHGEAAKDLLTQLGLVGRHVLAGLLAGGLVGALAPWLVDKLVRSEQQLLLVAISLAFVAFGSGQLLGGGGLLAVFVSGVWLSNGHYRLKRFDQHALERVMHPFNTAAELSVLLLLGFLVTPSNLIRMLPLGLLLALVLVLARLVGVWVTLGGKAFSRGERWIVAGCGLRGAVPLALAVAMAEELPHLMAVPGERAESLGALLLALIFVVVLFNLLLQTLVVSTATKTAQIPTLPS
ncbi:MAG: cation:proton antiporter [Cyanobacteriota bacterium]|nr:cation:proton antiporter [Cyanobacteriota bacterium]